MKKIYISISVLVIGLIAFSIFGNRDNAKDTRAQQVGEVLTGPIFSLEEDDTIVSIKNISLEKSGFVVIREVINNRPGQIVEVSELLQVSTGSTQNVRIVLPLPVPKKGVSINESGRPVTVEFVAVLYADNGDGGFNPSLDTVIYKDTAPQAYYVRTGMLASESTIVPKKSIDDMTSIAQTIIYTDSGFSPKEVAIKKGETVRFVNNSSRPMWVASNEHPMHNILPTFDQFTTSAAGETYQYTFESIGDWVYHDHVNASKEGVIKVIK